MIAPDAAPSPALPEAFVARSFDRLAGRFRAEVAGDDCRLRALVGHLGPVGGRHLLDLGCGKGRFAGRLEEIGARVVGLDLSAGMLREARGRGLPVARGSGRRLPFPGEVFDGVIAVEILEHVAPGDRGTVLAEASRVLRPGGVLVIVDKNAASLDPIRPWLPAVLVKRIDERRGRWMYPRRGPAREEWFWPGQVPRLLLRAGLEGVRAERLLSPAEARRRVSRALPITRRFVAWSARKPGPGARGVGR